MKKLILCGTALLFSLGFSKAQGWVTTGAHDDFAQTAFYKNGPNLEGVVWFADNVFTMGRLGDGVMTIAGTNVGGTGNYPLFGVNFNDSNDNGTGTSFTVDLTSGANITVDVENVSSQLLFMDIKVVDINGVQTEIEPSVSDCVGKTWADPNRKALNGFTLSANTRKTITIDLSSVAGLIGGLTPSDIGGAAGPWDCTGPNDCPQTAYLIDITKIKAVLFRVNFGSSDINLSEGDGNPLADTFIQGSTIVAYTGTIKVRDFKIGTGYTTGVNQALVNSTLSVYPNPAKEALNVSFNSTSGATVSISDVVGNTVYSTTAIAGTNNLTVNTSAFPTGMYFINITTEDGKVARKVNIR